MVALRDHAGWNDGSALGSPRAAAAGPYPAGRAAVVHAASARLAVRTTKGILIGR